MMSHDDYAVKLTYLETHDPLNTMIDKLRAGYTALNCIYLMNEIKKIDVSKISKKKPAEKPQSTNKAAMALEIQLRHLRQSRDELSNHFLQCVTDSDRANVSRRINDLTDQIVSINNKLNYFVEKQEMPAEHNEEKYPIPECGIELARLQHSLRNAIRRWKTRMDELFMRNDKDPKILEIHKKIRHLETHKMYVDGEIDRRKNT